MNFTELITLYGWPFLAIFLLIVVAILLFRERGGIKTLKLGPFEVGFSDKSHPTNAANNGRVDSTSEGKGETESQSIAWNKPVNIFYLGWDLGRASANAREEGQITEVEYHLAQACFHAGELGLTDDVQTNLNRLSNVIEDIPKSEWVDETLAPIDGEIQKIVGQIATMASRNQPQVKLFPESSLQWQTTKPELYSKAEFVTGIHMWVEDYLDATALLFSKASETVEEWRAAIDSYERSHASYPRMLVRAKSLKHESLEKSLELLVFEAEELVKLAQAKWNSPDKDNLERSKTFRTIRDRAVDTAASIYEILNKELARL